MLLLINKKFLKYKNKKQQINHETKWWIWLTWWDTGMKKEQAPRDTEWPNQMKTQGLSHAQLFCWPRERQCMAVFHVNSFQWLVPDLNISLFQQLLFSKE